MKIVTEDDVRMPEFRGVDLSMLEFRADGKIVRKDRWERAIRDLAQIVLGADGWDEWEISQVIEAVRKLKDGQRELKPLPEADCSESDADDLKKLVARKLIEWGGNAAKYTHIAADRDGQIWVYGDKPSIVRAMCFHSSADCEKIAKIDGAYGCWQASLMTIHDALELAKLE